MYSYFLIFSDQSTSLVMGDGAYENNSMSCETHLSPNLVQESDSSLANLIKTSNEILSGSSTTADMPTAPVTYESAADERSNHCSINISASNREEISASAHIKVEPMERVSVANFNLYAAAQQGLCDLPDSFQIDESMMSLSLKKALHSKQFLNKTYQTMLMDYLYEHITQYTL